MSDDAFGGVDSGLVGNVPPPPADAPSPTQELAVARAANGVEIRGRGARVGEQRFGQDFGVDPNADALATSQPIKGAKEARRLYGLDWRVSKVPSQYVWNGRVMTDPETFTIVREDNGRAVGSVGKRFHVIQNEELDIIDAISGEAPIVRGGVWDGGRRVWLQTQVDTFETPTGPAEGNMLVGMGHGGEMGFTLTAFGSVVSCRNTFRRNLAGAPNCMVIRHTASSAKKLEQLRVGLQMSREHHKAMQEWFFRLGRKGISDLVLTAFVDALFPKNENEKRPTRRNNRVEAFMDAYKNAPGAQPGTAWGLAQAVTYYEEHVKQLRAGTDRFERAFDNQVTQVAFDLLDELLES